MKDFRQKCCRNCNIIIFLKLNAYMRRSTSLCIDFCTQLTVKANCPLVPLLNCKSVNYEPVSNEIKIHFCYSYSSEN